MTSHLEKPQITEINVRIDCNGCVQKIKKALHGINGIYDLYINLAQQKLIVIGWADPERIIKAIKKVRKVATICSHREAPQPDSQATEIPPGEQPPEEGTQFDSGNPQPAEHLNPETEQPPGPPQPPPPLENQPNYQPPSQQTSEKSPASMVYSQPNQPENQFTHRDAEETHVTYYDPPDNGYRYSHSGYARGYSPGYGEYLSSHPAPTLRHELPPQASYQKPHHHVYHKPPSQLIHHAAASQPVYYEPIYRKPHHERIYYEPQPPVNHEPPQPPVSHETPQTYAYHEPPQTRVNHEPPQTPAYHEPPQTRVYHESPQTRVHHEPQETPVYHEPPQTHVYREPQETPVYHEPPQTHVYREPLHTHTIHAPPMQYFRNEPSTQSVYATHSYNRYRPSPHITEYEYVRSPPRYTTYSRMDYYDMDPYMDPYRQGDARNGYATSVFSDENPNACTIV